MSGSGNDFIIIDNRENIMADIDISSFVSRVCRRAFAVGADGLILIENYENADFAWRFYNSDGSEAEMCGNASRCVSRFAYEKGIAGKNLTFNTIAGLIEAELKSDRRVKVRMPDPEDLKLDYKIHLQNQVLPVSSIKVGVPHVVVIEQDLANFDVVKVGREVRNHEAFQPEGTNVNFIYPVDFQEILIRTYERGVEGETQACGTGSIAAALVTAAQKISQSPVNLQTQGGEILTIYFERQGDNFTNVFLEGEARFIYEATLNPEALLE